MLIPAQTAAGAHVQQCELNAASYIWFNEFLLVNISRSLLNLEEKNVKLFCRAETCIAALMYC